MLIAVFHHSLPVVHLLSLLIHFLFAFRCRIKHGKEHEACVYSNYVPLCCIFFSVIVAEIFKGASEGVREKD